MFLKIIISNIFLLFGIVNQTNLEINYQKSNLDITLINFNGQDYIPIHQLPKIFILNKEIISDEYSINYMDEKLIFSEFSFFVVYKSSSHMRVAQMSHPSTKINNDLCIPIIAFFKSLNSLNLINSQINGNKKIEIIDYSIFEKEIISKEVDKRDNLVDKNEKVTLEKDSSAKAKILKHKNVIDIYKFDKNQEIERGKYIIPRSIKK